MLTIAFWNIGKNQGIVDHVTSLAIKLQSSSTTGSPNDVLFCLAEPNNINTGQVLQNIVASGGGQWQAKNSLNGRFVLLTNYISGVSSDLETARSWPLTVTRVVGGKPFRFNVWFVHLKSPIGTFKPGNVQSSEAVMLRQAVEEREKNTSEMDTLIIGDFNMDPFSSAMVGPTHLNAVMCKQLAKRAPRVFDKGTDFEKVHRYFYNPTWQLLGDRTAHNQPGTFYVGSDPGDSTHWHMIDQVLLRPNLVSRIASNGVRIPTHSGMSNLLTTRGTIDKKISDHLPISISLNI